MSVKAIDYKILLKRDGQTQQQRYTQWLNPSLVAIDDRTKEDFFNYLKKIAEEVNFYDVSKLDSTPDTLANFRNGTWKEFFDFDTEELNALAAQASLPPHMALWDAFMEMYTYPQRIMNTLTQRHLDFYYGEVLALNKKSASPDTAHVIFELKKNTADTLLKKGTVLLAGKDSSKKDLHYQLSHDIVINKAKVADMKSVYVSPVNGSIIRFAPIANSFDGLGAPLDTSNPKWNAFGKNALPLAQVGFCLASPVLRMKEGSRTVTVSLTLKGLGEKAKNINLTRALFKISITGEKGWLGPKSTTATITSADNINFTASFSFVLTKEEPSVVNYNTAVHGLNFSTQYPLLQIMVNNEKTDFGYGDLKSCELVDATIEVQVTGIKDLQIENDFGSLNNKKPFLPFGAAPDTNANFLVGCEEAFSKRLKSFSVNVSWKNIPQAKLDDYYKGYPNTNTNAAFKASANFQDGYNWIGSQSISLFNGNDARTDVEWSFSNPNFPTKIVFYLLPPVKTTIQATGKTVAQKLSNNISYLSPNFSVLRTNVQATLNFLPYIQNLVNSYKENRKGIVNLRLNHSFYFKEYASVYANAVLQSVKTPATPAVVPSQPFAPEIQSISLNYTATTSKTSFSSPTLNDFVDEEIEFFHYGAFGQMREHAYTKSQQSFLNNTIVKLLPEYASAGTFFIGFSQLQPQDAACVLFQVAEGSANPDQPKANVVWSVLCDNYWKPLSDGDFIFDTTNDLLKSGVMKFVIPKEATSQNTIMPDGLLWLKANLQDAATGNILDSDAVCELTDVESNAAIVLFTDENNDASHLAAPLPANTIKKLDGDVAAVKSIKQPFASFGGRMIEDSDSYYTRVSERLRHKERNIALWDYERLILEHFPAVHKVKCINHATADSFYAPGNVLIILVPDLTNKNAVNPLQPRVDKNTLDEVSSFLQSHASDWITLNVKNPFYEPVRISVGVKLKAGFEFNYYQTVIDQQLKNFLSPWISDAAGDIHFGGKITKSMIVKFLEDMEFVDYLTRLRLTQSKDGGVNFGKDKEMAEASHPAAILVSADHHQISSY